MIQKLLDIFNIKLLLCITTIVLLFNNIRLSNKVDTLDNQLGITKSNLEQYQSMVNSTVEENRVLKLTVEDFRQSKDSLVQELNKKAKEQKIDSDDIKQVVSIKTEIRDTIIQPIPVDRDFYAELKPNELTTIKIERKDSVLTCIPEILNTQDLWVIKDKVWRNKYKNWFQRLIHFDFKKDEIEEYVINNSNDLIKVSDTRIIKIIK